MPRDQRLWMTFPIDFWMHPKVAPLSDAAFRAFVEMNGYSRQQRLDGVIPQAVALRLWDERAIDELLGSDPSRPLVLHTDQSFVIRDYAEHQETVADEEARRQRNRTNGAKGGRPRRNPTVTQSVTQSVTGSVTESLQYQNRLGTPTETQRKAESESEDYYPPSESQSLGNRARVSTDAMDIPEMTRRLAAQHGLHDLTAISDAIHRQLDIRLNPAQTLQVCMWLLGKAKTHPDAPSRYVESCLRQSPAEVEKHIHEAVA